MWVVLAASLAFGGVAIWLGLRDARPQEAAAPRPATTPAASAPLVLSPRPETTPEPAATAGTPAPPPAAAATPTAPPGARAPAPTPPANAAGAATPAAGAGFEIVVASFRTEARVSSVAAEVEALGLPIRRRLSDGWYQLICGPFTSRTNAEDAQQRLQRAGIAGTQIVPSTR
jgi:cell division septation protein DedD